ncbi:universal stress protein [Rhizobium sp. TH2]|uniref:serine/threonine protein kinase n=1 Tax=Rhizobium sp. TH2 TaxID=2775403 RepID=UPI0021574C6F|nr:bifunctional serine/threonine-protein kinase/universal stress protein [Rhizobium sp. TH2]UVC07816.1 universal stress protein [Rhizobium sp. TH2]
MAKSALTKGDIIDGFVIGDLVHNGGMARLWSVSKADIDMPLLMKVPRIGEGDDPAAIVSFEMEQMILPKLSGQHVPQFVANGDFAIQPYIVMERISGPSLYPWLEALPRTDEEVATLGAKIADALDAIHRQSVVHLDLNPSNIVFRDTGEAVLIDYGLACHIHMPDLMAEEFHLPYGTAPYLAPEQVIGRRTDFRSDLFALGVVMYFFATGEQPFGDPESLRGLRRRLWRDPWPPRALRPEISPALQEVILRCLEVKPDRRYQTAAQIANDLRDLSRVKLTARAEKLRRDPWTEVIRRRFNPEPLGLHKPTVVAGQYADAPIVLVAIDLDNATPERHAMLRLTTQRIIEKSPQARIACLNIQRINRINLDTSLDDAGHNKHVARLVQLKGWAQPIKAPEGAITYHVIEAVSPASAILDFARANKVDHIVMGARDTSALRSLIGSVAGEVAAEAPCTVTVVRRRYSVAASE